MIKLWVIKMIVKWSLYHGPAKGIFSHDRFTEFMDGSTEVTPSYVDESSPLSIYTWENGVDLSYFSYRGLNKEDLTLPIRWSEIVLYCSGENAGERVGEVERIILEAAEAFDAKGEE